MTKSNKAITLIVLIITIIVLLILAGVVINLTMGDNGIIGKVQTAVGKYENAQEKENSALAEYEKEIDNARETITISKDELNSLIDDRIGEYIKNKINSPISIMRAVLPHSGNTARTAKNYTANTADYTKTYSSISDEYLEFVDGLGWKIKKTGLYLIYSNVYGVITNTSGALSSYISINNEKYITLVYMWTSGKDVYEYAQGNTTMYLKKDDIVNFNTDYSVSRSNSGAEFNILALCN